MKTEFDLQHVVSTGLSPKTRKFRSNNFVQPDLKHIILGPWNYLPARIDVEAHLVRLSPHRFSLSPTHNQRIFLSQSQSCVCVCVRSNQNSSIPTPFRFGGRVFFFWVTVAALIPHSTSGLFGLAASAFGGSCTCYRIDIIAWSKH